MTSNATHDRPSDLELVAEHIATWLQLDDAGRILHGTDEERSPGPLLEIGGCASGNVVAIRRDVSGDIAREIRTLAADEPPLFAPGSVAVHDSAYVQLLGRPSSAESLEYWFPEPFRYEHDVRLVFSDTPEGDDFVANLPEQDPYEVWRHPIAGHIDAPWCIAVHDGQPASIVETVRIAGPGAECGVTTGAALRGRGFAAAAAVGWASHPALRGRTLFYSTEVPNRASQRLTQRLGLHYLGASYRIA